MSDRDERYRQQRDRYRAALIDTAAIAILGGMTVTIDFLPIERRLLEEVVHAYVNYVRRWIDWLSSRHDGS